jgi:hypothetical protein
MFKKRHKRGIKHKLICMCILYIMSSLEVNNFKINGLLTVVNPIFYAIYLANNSQTVPSNTSTKVLYPYNLFNVLTKYSNSEYLFRPTSYGGYYQMNACVCLPNITSGYISLFKNGVEFSRGTSFSSTTTSADTTLCISSIMYLNGDSVASSADYADIRVFCNPSVVISGLNTVKTYFNGHFIQR